VFSIPWKLTAGHGRRFSYTVEPKATTREERDAQLARKGGVRCSDDAFEQSNGPVFRAGFAARVSGDATPSKDSLFGQWLMNARALEIIASRASDDAGSTVGPSEPGWAHPSRVNSTLIPCWLKNTFVF